MKNIITIAASKGSLLEESIKILNKIGYNFDDDLLHTRKLFSFDTTNTIRILQVRPWDVPVYVEQGAADLGIVGKDVLMEKNEDVIHLIDLKFGYCNLVLAGLKNVTASDLNHNIKIATKYPNCTKKYFSEIGLKINIIKLYGAVELAPITGLSDLICDLAATGRTLKENKLHILDTLFTSSAILIANKVSMKFEYKKICEMVEKIKNAIN